MKLWRKYGITEVMMNDKVFFFLKFGTESEMIQCVEDGPWLFQNRPILLQKWRPAMELSKIAPQVILLWVKLFDVPLEFWNNVGLSYIASGVGVEHGYQTWIWIALLNILSSNLGQSFMRESRVSEKLQYFYDNLSSKLQIWTILEALES
ncbi:uncharacterized protein LOC116137295 [Pistacia vera]|uniref:uncharacterized protein LOC116137295 n=1 Tax=Pistacia vera TaxID=55513 RepID=UPI001263CF76|nr:uncharacterized protein LOC116137295 [Pistacia vera]